MVCDDCGTCEGCGTDTDGKTGTGNGGPEHHLEHGFKRFWRPIAAYVYLSICIFDFLAMPLYVNIENRQVNTAAFEEVRKLESEAVKLAAIANIDVGKDSWEPLTLQGGGLFHLSFGAIIGVAAFTRGREKVAAINTVG